MFALAGDAENDDDDNDHHHLNLDLVNNGSFAVTAFYVSSNA